MEKAKKKFPEWLKFKMPGSPAYLEVKKKLQRHELNTICQSAMCPNIGECWDRGTATFLIMGPNCTRHCKYCDVISGKPVAVDLREPERLAKAVAHMRLQHAVITSVTRDDLPDGGAFMFVMTIKAIRRHSPGTTIEVLTPEFDGNEASLKKLIAAAPDIFNHNIETVPRLFPRIRPKSDYNVSLRVLRRAKELNQNIYVKSGLIVGMGETNDEIIQALRDLKDNCVEIVTIGQYLRPSPKHLAIDRFVHPDEFAEFKRFGLDLGFQAVESAPSVRSSYHAESHMHHTTGPVFEAVS